METRPYTRLYMLMIPLPFPSDIADFRSLRRSSVPEFGLGRPLIGQFLTCRGPIRISLPKSKRKDSISSPKNHYT